MCEENLFELANILNQFEMSGDELKDIFESMDVNFDLLEKQYPSEEELSSMLKEGKFEEFIQTLGVNFDEFRGKVGIFFLKKHGIEMGKAMGGLPLDMEDMPDFIKSEIEKFLKNTSHCLKKELDKSFPFVIEEDEKCVVCLDDINSCGRKCARCKNIFHSGCIEIILLKYKKCPVCRASVDLEAFASVDLEAFASEI